MVHMRIDISESRKEITVDGILYRKVERDCEKVGRSFIASYLGCSLANLSSKPWFFPDFGEALKGSRNPYDKDDVIEWLSKPLKTRKQLYKEYVNEANEQDGTARASCGSGDRPREQPSEV